MTNWTSPAELNRDESTWVYIYRTWEYLMFPFRLAAVSIAITLIFCGVATWDVLSTFWFDWQIITGKRKWKWPMVRRASAGFHRTVLIFFLSDRL